MKRYFINLLREFGITLDVLLGGDHRRYEHLPPIVVQLLCDSCKGGEHLKFPNGSKTCQCRFISCDCYRTHYRQNFQKEPIIPPLNPVVGHYNENWVLVERYVNTFNPPDFHLIFKREETLIDTPVPEEVWRAFDELKLPERE